MKARVTSTDPVPEPPGPDVPAPRVDTLGEVAEFFGVTRQTPARWRKDGCEALVAAPYDLRRVREWLDAREANRTVGRRSPTTVPDAVTVAELKEQKLAAEVKRIEFDGRIKQVQATILEKSYYSRELVEQMFVERSRAMRAGLDLVDTAATAEIVALVPGAQRHRAEIEQAIRRELDHLYAAFASEDFYAVLEDRHRQSEGGVRVGPGRGRKAKS